MLSAYTPNSPQAQWDGWGSQTCTATEHVTLSCPQQNTCKLRRPGDLWPQDSRSLIKSQLQSISCTVFSLIPPKTLRGQNLRTQGRRAAGTLCPQPAWQVGGRRTTWWGKFSLKSDGNLASLAGISTLYFQYPIHFSLKVKNQSLCLVPQKELKQWLKKPC